MMKPEQTMNNAPAVASPRSLVMHSAARYYDLLAWLLTLGRERALRERLVELARLQPGETVLDVGCGTGSLAIAAKQHVGETGVVRGVDASPEMIEQARRKAAAAGIDIAWDVARAEALPFDDDSVDVVLSSLMMHHLPRAVREAFVAEIRRVLKPDGRVLVVDFEPPARGQRGLISRIHRHGHVPAREIGALLRGAELQVVDVGSVGASDLHFALATVAPAELSADAAAPRYRTLPTLSLPRWLPVSAAIALVFVAHLLLMRVAWPALAVGSMAALGVVAVVAVHSGMAGGLHALLRKHGPRRR
jgi:ubiquinone/menaquinone biosynthesis C-methylase UbiE